MKTNHRLPTTLIACGAAAVAFCGHLSAQSVELAHRYPLDTDVTDTVNGVNGALVSLDEGPGGTFENGGVTLSGNGYVRLEEFLFGNFWFGVDPGELPAVTVELFGHWDGGDANQRLFDFGQYLGQVDIGDPPFGDSHVAGTYAAVTPSNGSGELEFSMSANLTGDFESTEFTAVGNIPGTALAGGTDFHVVVVLDPVNLETRLYSNGALVGSAALPESMRQAMADGLAVVDFNNWLGRSQNDADPLFMGSFTEFRIWRGAMSPAKVQENFGCGPDNPDGCPAQLLHRYPLDTDVTDVVGGINGALISRDAGPGGIFEDGGVTLSGNGYVRLEEFLFGNLFFGVDVNDFEPVTLEMFGSWAGGEASQHLLDFGQYLGQLDIGDPPFGDSHEAGTFVAVSPSDASGNLSLDSMVNLTGDFESTEFTEVGATSGAGLKANQDFHVVVVIDPTQLETRLYRNGVLAGTGTLPESLLVAMTEGLAVIDFNNWLGRSQNDADPLFQGQITEFRIWHGAMSPAQVWGNFGCGPDNPEGCTVGEAPTLTFGAVDGNLTISWPTDALGFVLHQIAAFGGTTGWQPSFDQPLTTGDTRTATILPEGGSAFFELQAGE